MNTLADAFTRIAELPTSNLVSEEDVKNKVVLPMLRALGYDDADFNYERKTGRGYVDVMVESFPTGIVVEAKAPRTKLDQYVHQLENYVFHKHRRERATIAILTDGDSFKVYGVTEALWKGSLASFLILSFRRSAIVAPALATQIADLLAKENNEKGAIPDAISSQTKRRERLDPIEIELRDLGAERERIDAKIRVLQAERTSILGSEPRVQGVDAPLTTTVSPGSRVAITRQEWKHSATPHVYRLLEQAGANSRSAGFDRERLDRELVNKVDGVQTNQAVSFALIELRKAGVADYEGKPIRKVWLK